MTKTPEEATQTMIGNMPEKTGKSLEDWFKLIKAKKLSSHGEIMKLIKGKHGVTHGFANTIAILYLREAAGGISDERLVDAQYAGVKADLRPLYERLVKAATGMGSDVMVSPKKANVSLRRTKQFALIQPSTKDCIDLGLILQGVAAKGRLEEGSNWNGMCTHRVRLNSAKEFDAEVRAWEKKAYEQAK
jgi:hypothetical protein